MDKNDKILALLKELTEIESLSKKEKEIREFIIKYLKNLGYSIIEGENYIAIDSSSDLIVATHLDTVKIRRNFEFNGGYAYGTGVCDTKGSITAMLLSAEKGLNYSLVFFEDEEEDGTGSREFVNSWKNGKYVIVMEPTELKIASEHYGGFELLVKVRGKEAHGAYKEFGINAIERAAELIQIINQKFDANTLKIEGGGDLYVIPAQCSVQFEIFLRPEEKFKEVLKEVDFVKNYGEYEIDHVYEGFSAKKVDKFLERALRLSGLESIHAEMKSWTDALNLKDRFDVVVWGPGELPLCHTYQERIKLEDIKNTIEVLINLNKVL